MTDPPIMPTTKKTKGLREPESRLSPDGFPGFSKNAKNPNPEQRDAFIKKMVEDIEVANAAAEIEAAMRERPDLFIELPDGRWTLTEKGRAQ